VRNPLLSAICVAMACACATAGAADAPKKSPKAGKDAPGIVFRSLWSGTPAPSGAAPRTISYAMCPSDCTITVTVVQDGSDCWLKIEPELIVVASTSDLTWTLANSPDHEFISPFDVKFLKGAPKGWRNKKQDATNVVGSDANSEKNVHLYDVTVHLKTDHSKGCHTDPIIVNTG